MAAGGSVKVILGSLSANVGIAVAKGVAAAFTGSGAMVAEAIHSAADATNQVFLLIGSKESKGPPNERYPLGRGRAAYFWSFIVALMIFFGGGVFAIREGIHKLSEPAVISQAWIGFVVLGVATLMEAAALFQVIRAILKKKGSTPFLRYLKESKDADLVVLFAEDSAALLGLLLAAGALFAATTTGDGRWDAYGSLSIGVVLCLVAVWLAIELKSLLQGEAASPAVTEALHREAALDPRISEVLRSVAVQQGPGEVLLAAKVRLAPGLDSNAVAQAINELEARVSAVHPEIAWLFVEPDVAA